MFNLVYSWFLFVCQLAFASSLKINHKESAQFERISQTTHKTLRLHQQSAKQLRQCATYHLSVEELLVTFVFALRLRNQQKMLFQDNFKRNFRLGVLPQFGLSAPGGFR
jgi:hypothetical protein